MTKLKFIAHGCFSVLLLGTLLLGTIPAQAQTQPPNATPTPEGLSESDWEQIDALLPESAPYQQRVYVKASNANAGDSFGTSMALSGDTLVIGARDEASNATGVNGNQTNNSVPTAGAVYVFVRSGNAWSQQAYLKASNPEVGDHFGTSVAISGNTIVVGANGEDSNATGIDGSQADNSALDAGAAYVFTRSAGVWSQQAYLKASNAEGDDNFGASVAIVGDTIAVGAPWEDSNAQGLNGNQTNNYGEDSGAAYIFARTGNTWSQQVYVKSSQSSGGEWYDSFGGHLAMSGNTLAVDAPGAWVPGPGGWYDTGAVYVFVQTDGVWSEQAMLAPTSLDVGLAQFGWSIAISGNIIAVGAYYEAGDSRGVNNPNYNSMPASGAVFVFVRSGTTWKQEAYVKASNTDAGDYFYKVALHGDTLVVGAVKEDSNATGVNSVQGNNLAKDSGAAYVFRRSGSTWAQQAYLKASNTNKDDLFGSSVAVFGNTVVVGASGEGSMATGLNGDQADNSAGGAGAAYILDVLPPYVMNSLAANPNPTKAATVDFSVSFSEAVTGVNTSDFTLSTAGGVTGANIISVSGGPKTYTVSVSTGSGSGTLQLNVVDNDSIRSQENVPIGGTGVGNGNYTTGATYVVRPSSQTFVSQGQQDGWILESGKDTGVGGTKNNISGTFIVGQDGQNRHYRSILHFDTSSLPDMAIITGATIRIRQESIPHENPFDVKGDIHLYITKPHFGSDMTLAISDFSATPITQQVAGEFTSNPNANLFYKAVLSSIGRKYINQTGSTQFRLQFAREGNTYRAEYIKFFSGNTPAVTDRPTLILEYYVP